MAVCAVYMSESQRRFKAGDLVAYDRTKLPLQHGLIMAIKSIHRRTRLIETVHGHILHPDTVVRVPKPKGTKLDSNIRPKQTPGRSR